MTTINDTTPRPCRDCGETKFHSFGCALVKHQPFPVLDSEREVAPRLGFERHKESCNQCRNARGSLTMCDEGIRLWMKESPRPEVGQHETLCDNGQQHRYGHWKENEHQCRVCGYVESRTTVHSVKPAATCVCGHREHLETGECVTCDQFCGPVSNAVGQADLQAWAAAPPEPALECICHKGYLCIKTGCGARITTPVGEEK